MTDLARRNGRRRGRGAGEARGPAGSCRAEEVLASTNGAEGVFTGELSINGEAGGGGGGGDDTAALTGLARRTGRRCGRGAGRAAGSETSG